MNIQKINEKVLNLLLEHRFKDALILLHDELKEIQRTDLLLKQEQITETYKMFLTYYFNQIDDPQQSQVLNQIAVNILELTDKITYYRRTSTGSQVFHKKQTADYFEELKKEEAIQTVSDYGFYSEMIKVLNEASLKTETENKTLITPEMFRTIWLAERYKEHDITLIKAICNSNVLPWNEKCIAVSALTLSLVSFFDTQKFELLCEFYDKREDEVWQRALTGIVIGLFMHQKRFDFYPNLKQYLNKYKNNSDFIEDTNRLVFELLKSLQTEKLSKQFQSEILPNVQKMEGIIKDKIDKDKLQDFIDFDEQNPDWEEIFDEDPDLLKSLEKISELQMEGHDIFMGTFAMLKNFSFFGEISNWFMPFYKENPTIANVINDETAKNLLSKSLEFAFYLCNSDKYSFFFNLAQIPQEQMQQIVNFFDMEAQQMKNILEEDKLLEKEKGKTFVFSQYIQDWYRFFKLHPNKNEFVDFFELNWDLSNNILLKLHGDNVKLTKQAASYFFKEKRYQQALDLLLQLLTKVEPTSDLLEKIGYCYQKLNDYDNAIKYYIKAEMFDTNSLWCIQRIVFCYKNIGNYEEALKWAQKAEMMQPNDFKIQIMLAEAHMDLNDFEAALRKLQEIKTDTFNNQLMRHISKCALQTGNIDLAESSMGVIIQNNPIIEDYIFQAHIKLCKNDRKSATEYYSNALKIENYDKLVKKIFLFYKDLKTNTLTKEERRWALDNLYYLSKSN